MFLFLIFLFLMSFRALTGRVGVFGWEHGSARPAGSRWFWRPFHGDLDVIHGDLDSRWFVSWGAPKQRPLLDRHTHTLVAAAI